MERFNSKMRTFIALITLPVCFSFCGGEGGEKDGEEDTTIKDTLFECPQGYANCGGECVDIFSNSSHCGGCFRSCGENQICDHGTCIQGCEGNMVMCPDGCKDIVNDPLNCGQCGNQCPPAQHGKPVCRYGACEIECDPGYWDIDGVAGCEYECNFTKLSELCNGADDNCNGLIDEGFECSMNSTVACETVCGSIGTGICGISCTIPKGEMCTPPEETCNGIDDDCDTLIDEEFDCALGTIVPCTTTCMSEGTGICQPGCTIPDAENCQPPHEICNGIDDDCDTTPDNGYDCAQGQVESCITPCGLEATHTCLDDCRWGMCCAEAENCSTPCDDNCNGQINEDCGPAPPENDTCSGAINLRANTTFHGSTTYATDNSTGCGGSGGKDVQFYFDITTSSDVFIHTHSTAWNTVLYASSRCGGQELGCNDDAYSLQSELHLRSLPPGRYYLTLDGYSEFDAGEYTIDIYISPDSIPGDSCGDPIHYEGPISASTCSFNPNYTGSCGGSGNEVIYYFIVNTPTEVNLSTCFPATFSDTLLHLRTNCADPSTEILCTDDYPSCIYNDRASNASVYLEPGIYFLFMDNWGTECGSYRLNVSGT